MSDAPSDDDRRHDDRRHDDPSDDDSPTADRLVETIHATGHEHVTAAHASTFEFTTDDWLTPAGDCILAVGADRTPRDFDPAFKRACRDVDATITATITVAMAETPHAETPETAPEETIVGRGDPGLTLVDDRSMVGRTSDYTDDERTILVDADKAAADLDRDLVAALADGADATLRLVVEH